MTGDSLRTQRAAAIRDLVEMRIPPEQASTALARFGWDSEEDLYTLRRTDALRVLDHYLKRLVTGDDCRVWAEAIEAREDVGFEAGYEEQLKEIVFTLASPELTEPLTPDAARRWVDVLREEPERT